MRLLTTLYMVLITNLAFGQILTTSELPIIHIRTNGMEIEDEPKVLVDMGIIDSSPAVNNVNDSWNHYNGKVGIELRGNSTFDLPKKSFGLELRTAANADTSIALLGMPEEEDWILHSSGFDHSFLRNVLAFHLWRKMGHYASRHRFVELVIDNQYQGLYIFMERAKRDKNRLDISKLNPDENSGDDLTGGYILRMDWHEGAGFYSNYKTLGGTELFLQYFYPKAANITIQQKHYIASYIDTFEVALNNNYVHPVTQKSYTDYADLESFVDLFILNEYSKSVDAYKLSSFIHKDKDSQGGKLKTGPVWDFDLAFYNADYCGGNDIDGWLFLQESEGCDDVFNMPTWWHLMNCDSTFTSMVRSRWNSYRQSFLHPDSMEAFLDATLSGIQSAINRNKQQWDYALKPDIEDLKYFLRERGNWLDENLPGPCQEAITVPFEEGKVVVYPNPTTSSITMLLERPISARISITDSKGSLVFSGRMEGRSYNVDVSHFNPGIYFIGVAEEEQWDEPEPVDPEWKPEVRKFAGGKFIKW